MTQQDLQDRKDGLELFTALSDPTVNRAITRSFETQLTEYLLALLDRNLGDADALWLRAKAIGVVEVLDQMHVKISRAMDGPARLAARRRVPNFLNES